MTSHVSRPGRFPSRALACGTGPAGPGAPDPTPDLAPDAGLRAPGADPDLAPARAPNPDLVPALAPDRAPELARQLAPARDRVPGQSRGPARGSVTAEFALALPAVLALAAGALLLGSALVARVQCESAAHQGARAAMVQPASASSVAQKVAPGARVGVSRSGDWVRVRVSRDVGAGWFAVSVAGEAVAKLEPQWTA